MGAWAPEVSTICPRATKILNKEPKQAPKTLILRPTSSRTTLNSLVILHFGNKNVVGKKIFPPIKGKQTSTCLEICSCGSRCSAVEVSCLKMALMNLIVFEKP